MLNALNHPNWNYEDSNSLYEGADNPAQYVTVANTPPAPGSQINPEGTSSNGARDIQFRVQLVF